MNSFVEIPLANSEKKALVSPEDYNMVCGFTWKLNKKGYVFTGCNVSLHSMILHAPPGLMRDHINGDPLDNRRENLRLATPAENARNSSCRKNRRGGVRYKGVYKNTYYPTYVAKGTYMDDGKIITVHLGSFRNEEDAARAWDAWAKVNHGEFARLNFPDQ
jgi:hypothetical protein